MVWHLIFKVINRQKTIRLKYLCIILIKIGGLKAVVIKLLKSSRKFCSSRTRALNKVIGFANKIKTFTSL